MKKTINQKKRTPFKPIDLPVYQVDFLRLDDLRLKKGISLRMLKTWLAEDYNVYTSRNFINDFFSSRRCPSTCKASFFIAIADILGVNMDDYIVKCNDIANHTDNATIMNNNRTAIKSPEEGINKPTKRDVINNDYVEYDNGTVGSDLVKEGCVF